MSVENSQISDFFKNQTIFLTGGGGFLGKVLIEKLLRQCPDLERIYVLMRAKKNKTPEQRFEELFNVPLFDRLKSENVNALEKVSLVTGDCKVSYLGLGDQHLDILKRETTCVIHAAANVKFDQSLKEATNNVKSTKFALELSKQMINLKVFVYVSTAYSNCINSTIKEEFYDPPLKADKLFAIVDAFEDKVLERVTPILLGQWPNTYIYTKCISEDLVKDTSEDLPVVVVRPSIVVTTADEPMPGWIDNFYGIVGITVGAGLGVIKTLHGKLDSTVHMVPVDFVANCVLASAWRREKSGTTKIYNYVGSQKSILTWRMFQTYIKKVYYDVAFENALWYCCGQIRENKLWNYICRFFLHTVIAYVVDFVLFWCGKPTIAVKNYRRLDKMINMISPFMVNDWNFHVNNVEELWNDMNDSDRKYFNFDMKQFDWISFIRNGVMGGRVYLLKQPLETIPKAQRRFKILFVIHYTFLALVYYLLYKIISLLYGMFY